jgi:Xaa-Pro aminopeptidase
MGAALFPGAELVDANPLLDRVRIPKTANELACIATAAAIAESALNAMIGTLQPGVTERQLVGVYAHRIASLGSPPPSEGVACLTPARGPVALRRLAGDVPAAPGQLAALSPGAFFAGYEAGLARTWPVPGGSLTAAQSRLADRARAALEAVIGACVPGATGAEICQAWEATGEEWPAEPLVRGLGMGTERPVVGPGLGQAASLQAGMVVAVQAWVAEEGVGGVLESDTVLVGAGAPNVLTRYGRPDSSRNRA